MKGTRLVWNDLAIRSIRWYDRSSVVIQWHTVQCLHPPSCLDALYCPVYKRKCREHIGRVEGRVDRIWMVDAGLNMIRLFNQGEEWCLDTVVED